MVLGSWGAGGVEVLTCLSHSPDTLASDSPVGTQQLHPVCLWGHSCSLRRAEQA